MSPNLPIAESNDLLFIFARIIQDAFGFEDSRDFSPTFDSPLQTLPAALAKAQRFRRHAPANLCSKWAKHSIVESEMTFGTGKPFKSTFLLVGDGSGTGGWRMAGGWACAIIERESDERSLCSGGWSACDIVIAELSAYMQALMQLEAKRAETLRRHLGRPLKILIVTDNSVIATQSALALAGGKVGGDANPIWAAIRQIVQSTGTALTFRFAPRCSTMLNVLVDQIAGRMRLAVSKPELSEYRSRDGSARPLKSLNPKNR